MLTTGVKMYTRLDPEIEECLKQCQLQNSASPMTKQYLKLNILNKRHANGLSPINTTFTGEKKYRLRPDEEMKKEKRREQNRRAAAKCRNKKKWEERLSQAMKLETSTPMNFMAILASGILLRTGQGKRIPKRKRMKEIT
ncbi:homeobox 2-like [Octopus vulgaris]|uniref:Homeobox 2-like n=1 Tax=Octopus vulgaris TaxID=6645 RepID=A0AA36FAD6_OCTVU|nr:homeobox 2-like [Octopus vulgaris]